MATTKSTENIFAIPSILYIERTYPGEARLTYSQYVLLCFTNKGMMYIMMCTMPCCWFLHYTVVFVHNVM